jgi:hypothetical protein
MYHLQMGSNVLRLFERIKTPPLAAPFVASPSSPMCISKVSYFHEIYERDGSTLYLQDKYVLLIVGKQSRLYQSWIYDCTIVSGTSFL